MPVHHRSYSYTPSYKVTGNIENNSRFLSETRDISSIKNKASVVSSPENLKRMDEYETNFEEVIPEGESEVIRARSTLTSTPFLSLYSPCSGNIVCFAPFTSAYTCSDCGGYR